MPKRIILHAKTIITETICTADSQCQIGIMSPAEAEQHASLPTLVLDISTIPPKPSGPLVRYELDILTTEGDA